MCLLDGFPRTSAQAEALDGMLDGLGRKIASVIVLDVDLDELVRRLSGRRVCRAAEHVYHVEFHPPTVEGVCDEDGSELYQRDDDREDVIRARYEKQWVAAATPVLDYYTGQGLVARDRRLRPSRGRRPRASTRSSTAWTGAHDRAQDRGRARDDGHARARSSPRRSTCSSARRSPGVTLAELDRMAEEFITARGGVPTFKGYRGFPGSICASPNAMVVHGIPGPYPLSDGDLLSIDVGVTLDGYVADSAITVTIGDPTPEAAELIDACNLGLKAAIEQCREGNRLGDVSHAVQEVVEARGYGVVRSLVGHGVGRSMHEDPADPELRPARPRAEARGGHGLRDRADDHGRRLRRGGRPRRLGRLHPRRQPRRALRAHRRGDRERAAHPHTP